DFPDIFGVTAQVYYDRNDFDIGYPVTLRLSPLVTSFFREEQAGEWWGTELQLNKHLWEKHIVTAGAEFRDDFVQHRRLFNEQTGQVSTEANRDRHDYGLYAQGEFEVMTNLHFDAGLRFDKYGAFAPSFNPRLAL